MARGVALNLSASALTVLATVVFVGAVVGGIVPPATAPPTNAAGLLAGADTASAPIGETEAVVRRFYAAANETIRTGDAAALDGIVAANAVVHAALPGETSGAAGLAASLATVHAVWPGAELAIDDVSTVGDQAMVRVVARVGAGAFLDLALDESPPVWGRRDAFRVAGGRVVEFWSDWDWLVLLEPLGRTTLELPDPLARELVLERIRVRPGRRWQPEPPSPPRAIAVVGGRATVEFPTRAAATDAASVAETGRVVALRYASDQAVRIDASSAMPLVVAVALPYVDYGGPLRPFAATPTAQRSSAGLGDAANDPARGTQAANPKVAVERVASGPAVGLDGGSVAVSFGRVTLQPGGTFRLATADGKVVLGVEAGICAITIEGGAARLQRRDGTFGGNTSVARLIEDDGAYLPSNVVATLYNGGDEPAVALVANVRSNATAAADAR